VTVEVVDIEEMVGSPVTVEVVSTEVEEIVGSPVTVEEEHQVPEQPSQFETLSEHHPWMTFASEHHAC